MKLSITVPEEVFLLSIDSEGQQLDLKEFDVVLAGAILMELALQNCIDTDFDYIIPDKEKNTSHPLLNKYVKDIHELDQKKPISFWIHRILDEMDEVKSSIINGLVDKGMIKVENERVLLLFTSKKYPILRNSQVKEVKIRIRELVFSDTIPDFRDLVIVSLIHYAEITFVLFTEEEANQYQERIAQLAKMDLIGQAIASNLSGIAMSVKARERLGKNAENADEKFNTLIAKKKEEFGISDSEKLPVWLRKGTPQGHKTLEFIAVHDTIAFDFNPKTKDYFLL